MHPYQYASGADAANKIIHDFDVMWSAYRGKSPYSRYEPVHMTFKHVNFAREYCEFEGPYDWMRAFFLATLGQESLKADLFRSSVIIAQDFSSEVFVLDGINKAYRLKELQEQLPGFETGERRTQFVMEAGLCMKEADGVWLYDGMFMRGRLEYVDPKGVEHCLRSIETKYHVSRVFANSYGLG